MAHKTQIGPPFPQIWDHWHINSWLCFFDTWQVLANPFLTFFSKFLKSYAIKNFWGPRACGEKLKFFFSIFWRKRWFCWLSLDSIGSQLSFEVHIPIFTQNFKFFQFLVYEMSFLIFVIPGFIAVKVYNIGDSIWFQWKDKDQITYIIECKFWPIDGFFTSITIHLCYIGHYGPYLCDNVFPELVWNRVKVLKIL